MQILNINGRDIPWNHYFIFKKMSGNFNVWPNRLYNKGKYYRKHNDKHNDKRTNPSGMHYILNRYAQIASKYMKEKLIELKREIDKSTNIFGNFNTLFSSNDRERKQEMIHMWTKGKSKRIWLAHTEHYF